jgi:hypothetical protein
MHHHLKSSLTNRRARCVGNDRNLLNLRGYQMKTCVTTLLAANQRCGLDLSEWFGNYLPPLAPPLAAAA